MSFGFTYPYYRDPRDDERAIGALANRGRAPEGPSPDQVSSSLSALARMGLTPDETPPEPPPSAPESSPDAGAFAALRRQLEAQAPPEPESLPEPAVDPEIEQAVVRSAHGALSNKNLQLQAAAQALEPKPVDPEIARAGLASSYGALAQNAPPPPVTRKPSPVPVGLQDRVPTQEFNLAPPEPQSQAEYDSEHPKASVGAPAQHDDDPEPPGVNQWAIAADLMLNGGKGVQQIVGMAQQQRAAWQQSRRQKLEDAQKLQQYELGKGNLEARLEENKTTAARNARELDKLEHPDKYDYESKAQKAKREMDEWQSADSSQRGWSAQEAADKRNTDADNERKADNTRQENRDKETHRHNLVQEGQYGAEKPLTPAQKRQQERDDILSSPMPGVQLNEGEENSTAWKASMLTPGERGKVTKYVQGARSALTAMDDMIRLREENGVELYGDKKAAFDAAMTRAIAGYTEIGHSGVLNASEFERYKSLMQGIGPKWTDALDKGQDVLSRGKTKHDTVLESLRAVRGETRGGFDSGLSVIGAHYDEGKPGGGDKKPEDKPVAPTKVDVQPEHDHPSDDGFVPKPVKAGRQSSLAPDEAGELGAPTTVAVPGYEAFRARMNGKPADEDPDSDEAIRRRREERRRARGQL